MGAGKRTWSEALAFLRQQCIDMRCPCGGDLAHHALMVVRNKVMAFDQGTRAHIRAVEAAEHEVVEAQRALAERRAALASWEFDLRMARWEAEIEISRLVTTTSERRIAAHFHLEAELDDHERAENIEAEERKRRPRAS